MTPLIGRDAELGILNQHLSNAISGKGSTVLISGEPGIGKTALVEEFRKHAEAEGVQILSGAAMSGSAQPFQVFSKALEGITDKPLFEEQEYTSFREIFAVNGAGLLLGKASSKEGGLDADIFAGMLSAVQDFVRDSFGQDVRKAGLGRLEYGDMKILIEHGQHLFLTAVFSGNEHPDMKNTVTRTLKNMEESHGQLIEKWKGKISEIAPVQEEITKLAGARFLVRKDLEGVKLENERVRIADRVLETLTRLSADKVLLLFLEDLHWADESSLFVLNYLGRNMRKSPVLLLGTSRPGESDALQKAIENMKKEEIIYEMDLIKLDVKNTISLIDMIYHPNDFPSTLAERLFEQSKGNPLFVIEMLRGMHDDGSISMRDGKFTLISDSYHVPATVEEVVNRRLEALDPESMAMVEYASCIGQRFDISIVTSNRLIKNPDPSMEKLLETGILITKDGTMEFSHAVFQNVIYDGIGERWRTGHHKSIGEYLERAFADRLDDVIYGLARHFSMTREYRKISDYSTRAGEKSENSLAVEQALEFYNDALAAFARLATPNISEKNLEIMERCGDLNNILGDYDAAIGNYLKVKNASAEKTVKARMLRKVGEVEERKGEYVRSLQALAEARELADADTVEYGRIVFGEGYLCWRKGDYDRAMCNFQDALSSFEEFGEWKDAGNALRALGLTHHSKGEYVQALQYYEKSLELMANIGDKQGTAAALNNIGLIHWNRGELDVALEFYRRSLEESKKIGDKQGIAYSLINMGITHSCSGEHDESMTFLRKGLEIEETIGDKRGIAETLLSMGEVNLNMGNLESALEFYGRSLEMSEKINERLVSIHARCGLAETNLEMKNIQMSIEHIEKAIGTALEIGAEAEERMCHRVRGMIYRERKDWAIAEEEFEKAEKFFESTGNQMDFVRLLYEHGLLWKAKGDIPMARKCFDKALPEFDRMGMKLWAERCRKALQELDQ